MKTHKTRLLKFSKISIATIQALELKAIKGGTEPVSIGSPAMTQDPDDNTVCYAIR
ncbi:MAG: hypothetical protein AAF617_03775 [Bacteroidota bacterium]